jgi:hypothetical protein
MREYLANPSRLLLDSQRALDCQIIFQWSATSHPYTFCLRGSYLVANALISYLTLKLSEGE